VRAVDHDSLIDISQRRHIQAGLLTSPTSGITSPGQSGGSVDTGPGPRASMVPVDASQVKGTIAQAWKNDGERRGHSHIRKSSLPLAVQNSWGMK
jgi:hypothetical protein